MNQKKRIPKKLTEIEQAKIFKQIIMTPHPYSPTFRPRFPLFLLKSSYINERQGTKLERKSKNAGNITSMWLLSQEWIGRRY